MQRLRRRLVRGTLVLFGFLVVSYVVLVLTPWGQAHDNAAYVGRRVMARSIRQLGSEIMTLVQVSSIAIVAMGLLGLAMLRRRILAGLVVGVAWAAAIGCAELFKWVLPRPELVPGHRGLLAEQSFPSGHATVVTCAALALVLLVPARWRQWASVGAGLLSAGYSSGVVLTGMHRPSDALGALALSTAVMSIAALALIRLWGRRIEHGPIARAPLLASSSLAVVVAVAWWALARLSQRDDGHFLLFVAGISVAAFAVTAWFGAQMRDFDWDHSLAPAGQ